MELFVVIPQVQQRYTSLLSDAVVLEHASDPQQGHVIKLVVIN
jgi:hypothetical protein